MKTNQPIPETIVPWMRVVARMPLDRLWTRAGLTAHVRGESVGPAAVEALLQASRDYQLVEALMDAELRWYPRGNYGFWHHRACHHAAEPDNRRPLDTFPDSLCYFISEWLDPTNGSRLLLFEQHH